MKPARSHNFDISVVLTLLCLLVVGAQAATVTVNVQGKVVTSDDAKIEGKWLKQRGEQIGVLIQNTTLDPYEVLVKIIGLKDPKYDIYINRNYVGAKTIQELESGFKITIPGSVADPDMMLCLNMVKPMIDGEYLRLRKIKSPEPERVCATLQQAVGWVLSATRAEKTYRSTELLLISEGRMLEDVKRTSRLDAVETAAAVTRACWLLQQARARMSSVISEPGLRDSAVASLTPVDFQTSFVVKNGKPRVEAVVTNYCNLPISGEITAVVPKGWKWTAKNTSFKDLKTGKSFKISFDLVRTVTGKEDTPVPEGLTMAATIRLVQEPFRAEYNIRTIARTEKLESALRIPPGSKPPDEPRSVGTTGSSDVAPSTPPAFPDVVLPPEVKP